MSMLPQNQTRYSIADYGPGNEGLATVAYTLINLDSTFSTKQARTTTGVSEIGTNTAVYGVSFSVEEDWDGIVLWDDGQATKTYLTVESPSTSPMLKRIESRAQVTHNTIKNQADFNGEVMLRLAKMNNMVMDPDQMGKAFYDTLAGFDFSTKLKQSDMDLSKFEKGQDRIIDQIVGLGSSMPEIRKEIRKVFGDLSPQMEKTSKKLADSVNMLGETLKKMMEKEIKGSINDFKDRTGKALKLIGSGIDRDVVTPILESSQTGFNQQKEFLTTFQNAFVEFKDRFDQAMNLRGDILRMEGSINGQLNTLHTIFDSMNGILNQIRSLEDRLSMMAGKLDQNFRVISGKIDTGTALKVMGR